MIDYIGKFRIDRLLGKGATASVYLGVDKFSGQEVAVKIADPKIFDNGQHGRKFQDMFLNEASLAGKLQHPHIARLLDAGSIDDKLYIVMEYVDGGTLQEFTRAENLLAPAEMTGALFQCCNALDYACSEGIFHRDIKPANLMYQGELQIKVVDFGAALSAKSDRLQLTETVGTPVYLSPEMVRGEAADQRSDIFSLGMVMYQLLTGSLPYSARSPQELFAQILDQPLADSAAFNPQLPAGLHAIVRRCLHKRPEDRYQQWGELAADLMTAHQQLNPASDELTEAQKFQQLKSIPFFCELQDRQLWEILGIANWYRLPGDEVLVEEGSTGSTLYFIASGSARVEKRGKPLGVVLPGYSIGEVAFVKGESQTRTASVVSNGDIDLMEILPEDILRASDRLQSSIKTLLLKILAERLEQTSAITAQYL
ncbi:MAG: protein kinase [Gammaproteobacteria bacterium]|nr:protein kinase [Gammaproteobacteria bacterium]